MSARILSKKEIIERVKDHSIKISYYCLKSGGEPGNYEVSHNGELDDYDNQQSDAWKLFINSLDPDCLRLSVGPYALVEYRTFARSLLDLLPIVGRRFKDRKGQPIFDIFSNGPLVFHPGENVVIGTNEDISVSKRIGASLYAAVRNTDVGVPHISTTIDPGWRGRLQIGLVNSTNSNQEFEFTDQICKVRFHEFDHDCPDVELKPHSLSWQEIELDRSKYFFPRRKDSYSRLQRVKHSFLNLSINWNLMLAVLLLIWTINDKYHDFKDHYDDEVKQQNHQIDILKEKLDLKRIETQVANFIPPKEIGVKQKHITFNKEIGIDKKDFTIHLGIAYKSEPTVVILVDPDQVEYSIKILPTQNGSETVYQSVLISARLDKNKAIKEKNIKFDLFIVE